MGHPPATDSVILSDQPVSLLPPDLAQLLELMRYVWTGSSAIFIWDVLNNLKDDYRLLSKHTVGWPVLAYFTSRILGFVYIIGFMIVGTYPVGGCGRLVFILDCLYPVAIPATSLLFFFRVRAMYSGRRAVTVFFGLLWIVEFASCCLVPFRIGGANIGPTPYCVISRISPGDGASTITPTVFDTAVYVAISYRFFGNTLVDPAHHSFMEKSRAFLSGAYLPSLSRSLFMQGQVYYMITVISNIATSVMIFTRVSIGYHGLLGSPNIMLTTVLACRVYRTTRLGLAQTDIIVPSLNLPGTLPTHFVFPAGQTDSDPMAIVLSFQAEGGVRDKIPPESG
ncbi:hypothetical protein C8R44DRAFT_722786 [Mycena epipterygia]|nr:hypothetical protein C8R44DRAFT_722786 [Mycena epipterygia]